MIHCKILSVKLAFFFFPLIETLSLLEQRQQKTISSRNLVKLYQSLPNEPEVSITLLVEGELFKDDLH